MGSRFSLRRKEMLEPPVPSLGKAGLAPWGLW